MSHRWVLLAALALAGCPPQKPSASPSAAELDRQCITGVQPVEACAAAGKLYEAAPSTPAIRKRIVVVYYRACSHGHGESCARLGTLYERGKVGPPPAKRVRAIAQHVCRTPSPRDPSACVAGALHARACEAGVVSSCAALGALYESRRLGAPRPAMATRLYARACAAGHAASCGRVASASGDPAAAAKVLRAGCDAGEMKQCVELANLMERGIAGERDLPAARALRDKACKGKIAQACTALGNMWRRGVGGSRDTGLAWKLLTSACDLGDGDACVEVARAHERGLFGEPDMARHYELSSRAVKLYRSGCDEGDAHACFRLGVLYRTGSGVTEDRSRGLELQLRACREGHGPACIAWLRRGPHRVSIANEPGGARAVVRACRQGDGGACYAVGFLGAAELRAAGADPPTRPFTRGCDAGHAPSCNAVGILTFPPTEVGMRALGDACSLGFAPSCHHKGLAEELSGGVTGPEAAVESYGRACALGWAPACTRLGLLQRQGHVSEGSAGPEAAFRAACEAGDAAGCHELAMTLRDLGGGDPHIGVKLVERACTAGLAESCAELGETRLKAAGDAGAREGAVALLRDACDKGAPRACITVAVELGPKDMDARRALLERARKLAAARCDDGLSVCGGKGASGALQRRWYEHDDEPWWLLGEPPACGIALERACVLVRDAVSKRCELLEEGCFEAGSTVRKLAAAGLSISAVDAEALEARGLPIEKKRCDKKVAAACAAVATAYREGLGTEVNAKKAEHYTERACKLDKGYCD